MLVAAYVGASRVWDCYHRCAAARAARAAAAPRVTARRARGRLVDVVAGAAIGVAAADSVRAAEGARPQPRARPPRARARTGERARAAGADAHVAGKTDEAYADPPDDAERGADGPADGKGGKAQRARRIAMFSVDTEPGPRRPAPPRPGRAGNPPPIAVLWQ